MRKNKDGVSLIALVVIVIVMGMFLSIAVISTKGMLQETEARKFAGELKQLEYLVKQSRILNDNKSLNFTERTLTISNLTSGQRKQMSEEIADGATQITLYELDFDVIDADDTAYGKKENNDENDVYVVSYTTGKVYYLKGFDWEEETYYTLTEELNKLLSI